MSFHEYCNYLVSLFVCEARVCVVARNPFFSSFLYRLNFSLFRVIDSTLSILFDYFLCFVTFFATIYHSGSIWGTGGVLYILAKAIKRVMPIAQEPFLAGAVPLTQVQLG